MRIHIFLAVISVIISMNSNAQKLDTVYYDPNMIQLSGVVVSAESLAELPYTTVLDKTEGHRRGVISDYFGYFTLIVFPGDTIIFSAYGHKRSSFIVPDTLKDNQYSIIHMMQVDTLNLPSVEVFPWPSRENFARYFVNMDPYDDAIRRAQRELSGENLAFAAARLGVDGSLAYGAVQNQIQTALYTNNQLPVNNLLNPYAWSQLIKDWKAGKLARE